LRYGLAALDLCSMTKAEKEYLNRVAELGCIICRMPAEIHHLRTGMGLGMRNDYKNAIPLCPTHHRTGGHGVAYHAGRLAFESQFGTEIELLEKVRSLL
jgi:hypothetical protein